MASSYSKQIQNLVRAYRLAGGIWPASKNEIAEWALASKQWEISPAGAKRVLAEDIGNALREEYLTDGEGHRVRVKHTARMRRGGGPLMTLWGDIRTEPMAFMRVAMAGRRNGMVGEARQWYNDGRYCNKLHPTEEQIPLILDFTRDVLELDQKGAA